MLMLMLISLLSRVTLTQGDGGFGCGYKNIQTLCSALMQFPLYRQVLFDGECSDANVSKHLGIRLPQQTSKDTHSAFDSSSTSLPSPSFSSSTSSTATSSTSYPCVNTSRVPLPLIMPPIPVIQRHIDLAHQRGFDIVGAAQVGQLESSRTWIGAVEAHALFCSYGLKSELVDFRSGHVGLMEYVWQYFRNRTKPVRTIQQMNEKKKKNTNQDRSQQAQGQMQKEEVREGQEGGVENEDSGSGSSGDGNEHSSMSERSDSRDEKHEHEHEREHEHDPSSQGPNIERELHGDLDQALSAMITRAEVFDASNAAAPSTSAISTSSMKAGHEGGSGYETPTRIPSTFAPPIYFQHQGHSRTIVGIIKNLRTHRFRLIVLDPDMDGGGARLMHNLQISNEPKVVQHALRNLISAYGLMRAAEREHSKRPFSTVITAMNPSPSEREPGHRRGGPGGRGGKGEEEHENEHENENQNENERANENADQGQRDHHHEQAQQEQPQEGARYDRGAGGGSDDEDEDDDEEESSAQNTSQVHSSSSSVTTDDSHAMHSFRSWRAERQEVDESAVMRMMGSEHEDVEAEQRKEEQQAWVREDRELEQDERQHHEEEDERMALQKLEEGRVGQPDIAQRSTIMNASIGDKKAAQERESKVCSCSECKKDDANEPELETRQSLESQMLIGIENQHLQSLHEMNEEATLDREHQRHLQRHMMAAQSYSVQHHVPVIPPTRGPYARIYQHAEAIHKRTLHVLKRSTSTPADMFMARYQHDLDRQRDQRHEDSSRRHSMDQHRQRHHHHH